MKLAIIGSRGINIDLSDFLVDFYDIKLIISGGAKGVDSCAEEYARRMGIPTKIFLPQYDLYGRGAPLVRNKLIVEEADEVLALWDGKSTGTIYSLKYAKKLGKKIHLYKQKEKIQF